MVCEIRALQVGTVFVYWFDDILHCIKLKTGENSLNNLTSRYFLRLRKMSNVNFELKAFLNFKNYRQEMPVNKKKLVSFSKGHYQILKQQDSRSVFLQDFFCRKNEACHANNLFSNSTKNFRFLLGQHLSFCR